MVDCAPYVLTPYYRTVVQYDPLGCTVEPHANYTYYDVFCLETQLRDALNREAVTDSVLLIPEFYQHRQVLTVQLYRDGHHLELTDTQRVQLQNTVDDILNRPKHCVLFGIYDRAPFCLSNRPDMDDKLLSYYPKPWLVAVLPYIVVPNEFNPELRGNTLLVELHGDSNVFNIYYQDLLTSVYLQLETLYKTGSIVCPEAFARRWKLAWVDTTPSQDPITYVDIIRMAIITGKRASLAETEMLDAQTIHSMSEQSQSEMTQQMGLYVATWSDRRFAPDPTAFLLSRAIGLDSLCLYVGFNLRVRHAVVEALRVLYPTEGALFVGPNVLVRADDLDEAQTVAGVVQRATMEAEGKVVTVYTESWSYEEAYRRAATSMWPLSTTVMYPSGDPVRPLVVSVTVPLETDILEAGGKLRAQVEPPFTAKKEFA